MEHDDNVKDELLSYEDGPKFFTKPSELDIENISDKSIHDLDELLNYYRTRCAEFDQERREYLDRLATIESSHETIHRLKWDLKMKNEEMNELQNGLGEANSSLFSLKENILKLQAENDALTIQEMEDRKRIQHLLALTQPVTEEVTFFRDCRPGRMTRFPVSKDNDNTKRGFKACKKNTENSLNLESEATLILSQDVKPRQKALSASKQSTRVLRTVYLPSEQTDTLMRTVQMLKRQLSEQQHLHKERLESIMSEKSNGANMTDGEYQILFTRVKDLEITLAKTEDALRNTTKDYLVTRHNAQEAERQAHEEIAAVKSQCRRMAEERHEFRMRAQHETRAIREAITEEGNVCADEFRKEAITRERDMNILKEQYSAVQLAYTTRVTDLQTRLTKLRKRYKELECRRKLEVEGFSNDTMNMKRKLSDLEVVLHGSNQLKSNTKFDKEYHLRGNQNGSQLTSELSLLQQRFTRLATDLEEIIEAS